ncbi:hypothetical protein N431DRAFT_466094 [Stipitochalara longipes BDJ]|nr:hypothetical protein N431DRAFT_466094 [Stipitochalara longipes BDJ]
MSTSSGRGDKRCGPCGHVLDGHAHKRDSKCKKCKKLFDICQVTTHRGWRICFIPCSCGKEYYPDKARAAVPLASHEYDPSHPGYRALTPDEDEYDTIDQASSSTAQGGSMGHDRTDSTSSDPLGWSKERYQKETGSIDELVGKMKETHIGGGSVTAWSEWEWKEEYQQWRRYRLSHGEYEYEWRPDSSTSSTPKPKERTDTNWSEWELDEEHQRWCRGRWLKGEYVIEWDNPEPEDDKGRGKVSSHKKKGKRH